MVKDHSKWSIINSYYYSKPSPRVNTQIWLDNYVGDKEILGTYLGEPEIKDKARVRYIPNTYEAFSYNESCIDCPLSRPISEVTHLLHALLSSQTQREARSSGRARTSPAFSMDTRDVQQVSRTRQHALPHS